MLPGLVTRRTVYLKRTTELLMKSRWKRKKPFYGDSNSKGKSRGNLARSTAFIFEKRP
jgi:hypothetical protein